jgi:hypothetical protein
MLQLAHVYYLCKVAKYFYKQVASNAWQDDVGGVSRVMSGMRQVAG